MKFKITFCLFLSAIICFAFTDQSYQVVNNTPPKTLGEKIYKKKCSICHSKDGNGKRVGAVDLRESELDLDGRVLIIKNGRGAMTPFKDKLSEEEIKAVAEYTFTLE